MFPNKCINHIRFLCTHLVGCKRKCQTSSLCKPRTSRHTPRQMSERCHPHMDMTTSYYACLSLSACLSLTAPLSLTATLTHCHYHSLPLSLTAALAHCHYHSLPLSLTAPLYLREFQNDMRLPVGLFLGRYSRRTDLTSPQTGTHNQCMRTSSQYMASSARYMGETHHL